MSNNLNYPPCKPHASSRTRVFVQFKGGPLDGKVSDSGGNGFTPAMLDPDRATVGTRFQCGPATAYVQACYEITERIDARDTVILVAELVAGGE